MVGLHLNCTFASQLVKCMFAFVTVVVAVAVVVVVFVVAAAVAVTLCKIENN